MTNNKNMGKRVKNQNQTCTIHRNTTHSFISLGSNIQFSTNTEKEQVIIKKLVTMNKQNFFLCVQTPFQVTYSWYFISFKIKLLFKINLKTANDKKK